MNKQDISKNVYAKLAEKGEYSRDGILKIKLTKTLCTEIVNEIFSDIRGTLLKGGEVSISQFGIFRIKTRKGYLARNPKTNEKVKTRDTKRLALSVSKTLKEDLNK